MIPSEIVIVAEADRERLAAEIWCLGELWCILSQETGDLVLEVYPHSSGDPWRVPYWEAMQLFVRAAARLASKERGAGP